MCVILRVSYDKIVSSVDRETFHFSSPIWRLFIRFSSLVSPPRTCHSTSHRHGQSEHPASFLTLGEACASHRGAWSERRVRSVSFEARAGRPVAVPRRVHLFSGNLRSRAWELSCRFFWLRKEFRWANTSRGDLWVMKRACANTFGIRTPLTLAMAEGPNSTFPYVAGTGVPRASHRAARERGHPHASSSRRWGRGRRGRGWG